MRGAIHNETVHGKGEGAGNRVRGMADMAEATIEFDEERNLFGRTFNDN